MKIDTITSTPQSQKPTPEVKRACLKCGQPKPLKEFFSNKEWIDQLHRDVWCIGCFGKCQTKEDVREYFWENHREFSQKMWDAAQKRAEKLLNNNEVYMKSSEDRRLLLLEKTTITQIPGILNMKNFYKYYDSSKSGFNSYAEAKASGAITEEPDDKEKKYDDFFNGYFTASELKYLEDYYVNLEKDFSFDNENLRDYAKKVCRASLQLNKAWEDYNAGRCPFSDVKDASILFDTFSKSANFAACKRKVGDTSGLTCWAETTLRLEQTGHTMQRKIEWPEDSVDRVINNYRHIVASIGLDSI